MMDKEKINRLLHESFHRRLNPEEQTQLDQALEQDEALRLEKEDLQRIVSDIGNLEFRFREGFAGRVLSKIGGGKIIEMDFSDQLFTFFKRIVITSAAAIILLLLSIYFMHGSINRESVLGVQSLSEDNLVSYLLYEEEE